VQGNAKNVREEILENRRKKYVEEVEYRTKKLIR
jgi:hypothetical protein